MPLLHGRITKGTYAYLVDKVRNKIASWKGRLLSKASRNILIQSVSSTIPFYAMQTAALPVAILEEMERLNRCFF